MKVTPIKDFLFSLNGITSTSFKKGVEVSVPDKIGNQMLEAIGYIEGGKEIEVVEESEPLAVSSDESTSTDENLRTGEESTNEPPTEESAPLLDEAGNEIPVDDSSEDSAEDALFSDDDEDQDEGILADVEGMKKNFLGALSEIGIETVTDLKNASLTDLAKIDGISKKIAKKLIEAVIR